ncbi:MAG: hypothetical protein OYK82_00615 [Gammaproteobacteria bacterium]|nr:hypothetical protein [Gammaproteobacteria bacterium]
MDPMEEGGPNQPPDKKERTARAKTWLERNGVGLGDHPDFPRADIVAARHGRPSYVIEVKGEARVQKGVAIQQALGQIQQQMRPDRDARYVIATPNTPDWEDQMERIPAHVCDQLSLRLWLVDETGVQEI